MKAIVLGGGPAGLYAATLLKRTFPSSSVTVLERNEPHEAYGFGVVFSAQTMRDLKDTDEDTFRALSNEAPQWNTIEIRHRGVSITTEGHRFWAITRPKLLEVLQEKARRAGAEVHFGREVRDLADLEGHDLLVGADGVNSLVRRSYASWFQPSECANRSNYIWLGCTKRFDSFVFIFEETRYGAFGAHIYPIDEELSTFVVDASEETLENAGLTTAGDLGPGESDQRSTAYLEEVFAEHLGEGRLIANNSRWLKFRELRNACWSYDSVVLLGDAAHTAHPNVGSGTKMALEDAVALRNALRGHDDIPAALENYEERRRPDVERIQRAAHPAGAWWDWFGTHMGREPEQFVYHYLTRTPRINYDQMRTRDRRLVKQVEGWWEEAVAKTDGERPALSSPLAAPLTLRGTRLTNRIAAEVILGHEKVTTPALAALSGYAVCGAGLVLATLRPPEGNAEVENSTQWSVTQVESLQQTAEFLHTQSAAKLGLRIVPTDSVEGRTGPTYAAAGRDLTDSVQVADNAGFDLLDLVIDRDLTGERARTDKVLSVVQKARATWAERKPLAVSLMLAKPSEADISAWLDLVGNVRDAGADLVGVAIAGCLSSADDDAEERMWGHLLLSDLARNRANVATMLVNGASNDRDVDDAVLSGRADICCGKPRLGSLPWLNDPS